MLVFILLENMANVTDDKRNQHDKMHNQGGRTKFESHLPSWTLEGLERTLAREWLPRTCVERAKRESSVR